MLIYLFLLISVNRQFNKGIKHFNNNNKTKLAVIGPGEVARMEYMEPIFWTAFAISPNAVLNKGLAVLPTRPPEPALAGVLLKTPA